MADEINNNDNSPMTVLKRPILAGVAVLIIAILMFTMYTLKAFSQLSSTNEEYSTVYQEYTDKLKTIEDHKAAAELAESSGESADQGADKPFFKPLESGSDPDVVLAGEFNEILSLVVANKIKTRSVKYDYEPKGDVFFMNATSRYSVCRLDMVMIANYTDFKNFLKDLYKHEHYLDITKVEIQPYSKDKSILIVNFQLTLYAERA